MFFYAVSESAASKNSNNLFILYLLGSYSPGFFFHFRRLPNATLRLFLRISGGYYPPLCFRVSVLSFCIQFHTHLVRILNVTDGFLYGIIAVKIAISLSFVSQN